MPHAQELLNDLNAEQRRAVTHGDGPQLIVAGAGTGKTTVITKRIAWLILDRAVPVDGILALTFTEKAAGEMEERIDRLLPYGYVDLWVSTFHHFCDRLLRAHALDIGLPHDYRLLDPTAAWLLMRKHLDAFALDYYRPRGNPTKFLHALHQHFSRCKDEAVTPEDYLQYAQGLRLDADHPDLATADGGEVARLEELAHAYHVYQQLLLANHAIDFGDLLVYTLQLLRDRPAILARYRQQFQHILVDEFQDTIWAQYEIVNLLAAPANNLSVVGDDDQSVYAFRGAAMSNILHFKEDFPDAVETAITVNYRSKQEILDAAYTLIQENNPARLEVTLKLPKRLTANAGRGGAVEVLRGADSQVEAQLVADRIAALRIAGVESQDIAILVRANSQADQFLPILAARGIPAIHLASRGLYRTAPVLDILAYLQILDNVHESPAFYRVLNIPVLGFTYEELLLLSSWASRRSISLYEACRNAAEIEGIQQETLTKVTVVLERIARNAELARHAPVRDVILAFLNDADIGYLRDMTDEETVEDHERVQYLNAFWKRVEQFEDGADEPTTRNFMEIMRLEREAGETGALPMDTQAGPDAVRILTIHASKGLEFRHVFVVNMVQLRFPASNHADAIPLVDALTKVIMPDGDTHLQEERRLCYVAATRAKDGLTFTFADDYGGARARKPSRFLAELGCTVPEVSAERKAHHRAQARAAMVPRVPQHALPKKLSFTQVQDYLTCPWMYHYRHILKIPISMDGKGAISFGKTIHRTLERFFAHTLSQRSAQQTSLLGDTPPSGVAVPTLARLLELYREAWVDDWYLNATEREKASAHGMTFLRKFYAQHERDGWPTVAAVEQPFTIKFGDVSVAGSIDRVDALPSGGVALVDYKTGKRPARLDRDQKRQLFIYQIAARQSLHKEPEVLMYYYFDDKPSEQFLGSDRDLEQLEETVVGTHTSIMREEFAPDPDPQKCRRCEYQHICPFSKAKA
ncbi:MAG: UvrD-helicase domain-containing protein [bacterium]|nr:UvrD-helicase domain-containing protein [bacterium]